MLAVLSVFDGSTDIPTLKLNNGIQIPLLVFGTAIKPDGNNSKKDVSEEVKLACSEGFRHIDCAERYGNERSIGEALRGLELKREDFALDVGLGKTWLLMEGLQKEGKATSIGVSNCRIDDIDEILKVGSIELHPYCYDKAKDLVDYCHSKGITIEAFSTLAPLTKFPGGPVDAVIKDIAKEMDATEDQILIRWAHQVTYGGIVITSSCKKTRLQGYRKALTEMKNLSDDQIKAINDAGAMKHQRVFGSRMDEGPSV
ncbi:hypothetical protein QFC22_000519 [Naganishia vaughanmartiniae]|uniref:Uncharacterized protein n=1 Tax=Naganishia vaughanmartiniae TaxID=1424756 RepID=A0ACC2XNK2_9TREE|nr:hypothetical protein QFC22_000519 [Naganishia vaughanmartiniae]